MIGRLTIITTLGLFSKIIKRAQQALASNPNLQINELKFKQSFDKDIQIHRSWITVSVNNQEIVSANNEIDMKNLFDLKNIYMH